MPDKFRTRERYGEVFWRKHHEAWQQSALNQREYSEADKRRIVEETARPGASLSEVARHYGIAARVLFRWKQELTQAAPLFVAVEITDAIPPTEEHAS